MASSGAEQSGKPEQDLRKGVLVLAVLSQLRTQQYGYSLRQALAERGMPIEEGTLYPLLRRLEGQGLLASEWRIEDGPPRRYYTLSAHGAQLYRDLTAAWGSLTSVMNRLLDGRTEMDPKAIIESYVVTSCATCRAGCATTSASSSARC